MDDLPLLAPTVEHLTPHDLVTYSRCPHEMELHRTHRHSTGPLLLSDTLTLPMAPPEHHSPLFLPALPEGHGPGGSPRHLPPRHPCLRRRGGGRPPDALPAGAGAARPGLPAPRREPDGRRVRAERTAGHGRPAPDGVAYPIEYKSTHLFTGYHGDHGRPFDVLQAIAECRLVHAASGIRPRSGVILYGDADGDGGREGWVEVEYGDAEEHWLRAALMQIRADHARAPVPNERNCSACEPNRASLCPAAAVPYSGPHPIGAVPFASGHSTYSPARSR